MVYIVGIGKVLFVWGVVVCGCDFGVVYVVVGARNVVDGAFGVVGVGVEIER